jgi:hypothetical protein
MHENESRTFPQVPIADGGSVSGDDGTIFVDRGTGFCVERISHTAILASGECESPCSIHMMFAYG